MEKITINGIAHIVEPRTAGSPTVCCSGERWQETRPEDFLDAEPVKRLCEITCPQCLQKARYYRNVLK